jgi:Ca2+-binding RTX toxin-like protein
MGISTQDYALLAQKCYLQLQAGIDEFTAADGQKFKVIAVSPPNGSGYFGAIYQNETTGELVVAHRGTETDGLDGILHDVIEADGQMALGLVNQQVNDANQLVELALELAKTSGPAGAPVSVTVTGHSLGGSLAQVTASEYGLYGETFNAYGAAGIDGTPAGGNQVVNYVRATDMVAAAGEHFGKVIVYANASDRQLSLSGSFDLTMITDELSIEETHGIAQFVDDPASPGNESLLTDANHSIYENDQAIYDAYRAQIRAAALDVRYLLPLVGAAEPLVGALYGYLTASYVKNEIVHAVMGLGENDTLSGDDGRNFIRGGLGADRISGGGAADLLFGDRGNDVLRGLAGDDGLYGAYDDDYLDGGAGSDRLEGGAGYDRYDFSVADFEAAPGSVDTILDSDGNGQIEINAVVLSVGQRIDETTWRSLDGRFLISADLSRSVQVMRIKDTQTGSTVLVNDWANGALGIQLGGAVPAPQGQVLTSGQDLFGEAGSNAGADSVLGAGGNDGLEGGFGNDVLDGGDGADLVLGGPGNDHLYGGDGNDLISDNAGIFDLRDLNQQEQQAQDDAVAQLGSAVLARGSDWYIYRADGAAATGDATLDKDFLLVGIPSGAQSPDPNVTPGGDDIIDAGAGSDIVFGGEGDDQIQGGTGNDAIDGGHDNDVIYGGDGNDRIDGDTELDNPAPVAATANINGNDLIDGGAGADTIRGGGGDDVIFGGTENDILIGRGRDTPADAGDTDSDYMDGGAGDDQLAGNDGDDVLIGGDGSDIIRGDDAMAGTKQGSDHLDGGAGQDYLYGDGGGDVLLGGDDADQLVGDNTDIDGSLHGADLIDGGAGNDVIFGLGGADTIFGGDGADQILGDADTTVLAAQFHGADAIYGEGGNDAIWGNGGDDTLDGGADDDQLSGGDGADHLSGGTGADHLYGDAGNDSLAGDEGDDVLQGADGNDSLNGGAGLDGLFGEAGNDVLRGGDGNDELHGGDGADQLYADGGNDKMWGDAGDDTLNGGAGANQMLGGDGNDNVSGAAGNDALWGDAGDDTLDGGTGNDQLTGGAGADVYVHRLGDGTDTILESSTEVDTLRLGAGVTPDSITLYQDGTNLVVLVGSDDDRVVVSGFFGETGEQKIERIEFDDGAGAVWEAADITAHLATANTSTGGIGGDTYQVDNPNDTISEPADGGIDTVESSVTFTLPANVENITLTGSRDINATGNSLDNVLRGNSGDNILRGYAGGAGFSGDDTAYGGAGDDTYYDIDHIVEEAGEGYDKVVSISTEEALADNVESLLVQHAYTQGPYAPNHYYGNSLDNSIVVSALGETVIDGGAGADFMSWQWYATSSQVASGFKDSVTFMVDDPGDRYTVLAPSILTSDRSVTVQSSLAGRYDWESFVTSYISTSTGVVEIFGNGGNNRMGAQFAAAGSQLVGGAGNDTYVVDGYGIPIVEQAGGGSDTIEWVGQQTTVTLVANTENILLGYQAESSGATGDAQANVLTGNNYRNILTGDAGDDRLDGNGDNDTLSGGAGNDILLGGDGNDVLDGGTGADVMQGGQGADQYFVDDAGDVVDESGSNYLVNDTVVSSVSYTIPWNVEIMQLTGTATTATGDDRDNRMAGNDAANVMIGGKGHDTLTGGKGADLYLYNAGDGNDSILETANVAGELDAIQFGAGISASDVSLRMGDYGPELTVLGSVIDWNMNGSGSLIEQLRFADGTVLDVSDLLASPPTVNGSIDDQFALEGDVVDIHLPPDLFVSADGAPLVLSIEALPDGLEFDPEAMTITGTLQNHSAGEHGIEIIATGADGQRAWTTFDFVVRNPIRGGSGSDHLVATDDPDAIFGNAGNDTLTGGGYLDLLNGGTGNDTYIVDDSGVEIVELEGEGDDLVVAYDSFSLGDNIERLTLTGSYARDADGNALGNTLTGNEGNNNLVGYEGDDILVGGGGEDYLEGDEGNDVYYYENGGANIDNSGGGYDGVVLADGIGLDRLAFSRIDDDLMILVDGDEGSYIYVMGHFLDDDDAAIDYIQLGDGTMLDTQAINALVGDSGGSGGSSQIDGTESDDTLSGTDGGDDIAGYQGNDKLYGKGGDDALAGGDGNDRLNGGAGADAMSGGTGDDTYYVDDTGDTVAEAADEGTDTVVSTVGFALGADVENLTLSGDAAIDGTGNDLANKLSGNAAANVLDGLGGDDHLYGQAGDDTLSGGDGNDSLVGGIGADAMAGGAGNDTYYVDDAGDTVAEAADAGTDRVSSTVGFALGADIENLTLTGTDAVDGTGNELANTLSANDAANVLDGRGGNDKLYGKGGNDALAGGDGNDMLNGGTGADAMAGGAGNDTYYVDDAGDTVAEAVDAGTDVVVSTVGFALGADIENLTLSGEAAIYGTGNDLANKLTGNDAANALDGQGGDDRLYGKDGDDALFGGEGNDILTGGAGADAMTGGVGDDTYYVDDGGDTAIEAAGEGSDRVSSTISFALGANIENLSLTGTAAIDGTGNELANTLAANEAANVLDGGAGNDRLYGKEGSDTYLLARGTGSDTVIEADAQLDDVDVARFTSGVAFDQLWFSKSGNNLVVSIIGTADRMVVANWFLGQQYQVEQFVTDDDGRVLQASDVQSLVDAMSQMQAPAPGQTTLSAGQHAALDAVLDAAWSSGGTQPQGLQPQGTFASLAYLENDAWVAGGNEGIRVGEPDPTGRSGKPTLPGDSAGGQGRTWQGAAALDIGGAGDGLGHLRQQLDRLVQAMAAHPLRERTLDGLQHDTMLEVPNLLAGTGQPKVLEDVPLR